MHRSKLIRIVSIICIGITAAGLTGGIRADCIESAPPNDAAFIAVIDATTSCSAISGQFGCSIDDGVGWCTATDPNDSDRYFTVNSTVDANGASWALDVENSTIKVDAALVGGATQGNACAYSYQYDTDAGTGGFLKNNGSIANITFVDICSDSIDQVEPPPPPEPTVTPSCSDLFNQDTGLEEIDSTGVICPNDPSTSLVCNIELTDSSGEPVPFYGLDDTDSCCVCNAAALQECDPSIPEGAPGACAVEDPNILATEVTTIIELNNDPYFCRTIGGVRRCYSY